MCDVSKVDLIKLIFALWENAGESQFYEDNPGISPPNCLNEKEVESVLKKGGKFDYLAGRIMKFSIKDGRVDDVSQYNKNKKHFTFEEILKTQ